ncbi:hypothetical protein BT96DRAFT_1001778 [Gymnopus androsaceus JB14]|uniref:Transposase family Tnp2 protein n=1 Tax=Gymnopus androsaceus JB14 TaxID=1447944 RepID=A0A6A4H163_9AGAR|nr:hypothetical protein BT96DRAFT_1001778 [Gymnopus androsaceus JB14]
MPKKKKRCHCTRFCTSVIGSRARRNHYNALPENNTRFAPSSSEDSDADTSDHYAPDHITLLKNANTDGTDNDANDRDNPSSALDSAHFEVNYSDDSEYDASSESGDTDMDLDLDSIDFGQNFDDTYLYIMAQANPWAAEDHNLRQGLLDDADLDAIKAFKLKVKNRLTREAYNDIRFLFCDKIDIDSEWRTINRMATLAEIKLVWYDCCINTCMAFTGIHADLDTCIYCNETRNDALGNPRRRFGYLPLIPRLQGLFQSERMVKLMSYRHSYVASDTSISDVFDCTAYRRLLGCQVVADGKKLPHTYFSGEHDIALSFYSDGYLVFRKKRQGPSATPLLLKNLNLNPTIRTQHDYLIPLGLIPGTPKDMASFVHPFQDELVKLAHAFSMKEIFEQFEKLLNIKGVNGFSPCRSCEIKGMRDPSTPHNHYYYPLSHPQLDENGDPMLDDDGNPICKEWDPFNLPYRTHESFSETLNASITGSSSPHDWMHIFENVIPNLIKLWTGKFKGLLGDYVLDLQVWEEIGRETENAVKDIPSAFVRKLFNIATEQSAYNAEAWVFWFMWLMPTLLKGQFNNPAYYFHACNLRDIMVMTVEYTTQTEEIDTKLRQASVAWVREYERLYFRYDISRLSACTLTVHIILHIPDDILFCGPSWATWTFFGERFCGILQTIVASRSLPYANLTNRLVYSAYLAQIICRYDLSDALALPNELDDDDDELMSKNERCYDDYPLSILRPPHQSYQPSNDEYSRIIRYFKEVTGKAQADLQRNLPRTSFSESWGKVCIGSGGDSIRCAKVLGKSANERNNSFVRYTCLVKVPRSRTYRGPIKYVPQVFYGRLDNIVTCIIPDMPFWEDDLRGKLRILAFITPCQTEGQDATKGAVEYKRLTAQVVLDLQTISAAVGRVHTRGRYGIIDRSSTSSSTTFVDI